jgi:putative endonuclease
MLKRMLQYYVYILASRPGGAIYVGVTNNLIRRVYEHKSGSTPGFTKTYGIDKLVYYEIYSSLRCVMLCSARRTSSTGREPGKPGSSAK